MDKGERGVARCGPGSLGTRRFVGSTRVETALTCTSRRGGSLRLISGVVRGTGLGGKLARERTDILLTYSSGRGVTRVCSLTRRVGGSFCNGEVIVFTPLCLSGCYMGNYLCYPCRRGGGRVTEGGLARSRIRGRIVTLRSVKRGHLTVRTNRSPIGGPVRCVLSYVGAVCSIGRGGNTVHHIGIGVTTAAIRGCEGLGRTKVNACVLFRRACRGRDCRCLRPANPGRGCTCRARTVSHTVRNNVSSINVNILFKLSGCHCRFTKLLVRTRRLRTIRKMNPRAVDIPHIGPTSSVSPGSFSGSLDSRVFYGVTTYVEVTIPCANVVVSAHRDPGIHRRVVHLNMDRVDNNSEASINNCYRRREPRSARRFSISSGHALSRIIG